MLPAGTEFVLTVGCFAHQSQLTMDFYNKENERAGSLPGLYNTAQ
jgi:hypothetical protein